MPLAEEILHLTQRHGNPEEKQLLSRWQAELRHFLAPFEREIRSGQQALEIGLEPNLVLKAVVKRRRTPPVAGLLRLAPQLPSGLREIAMAAATGGHDFHVGIRLNPDSAHRELYLYNRRGAATPLLPALPPPPEGLIVTAYGVDEQVGLSAYCTGQDNPQLLEPFRPCQQALDTLLHRDISRYLCDIWRHYRLAGNGWQQAKFGLEYKQLPLPETVALLSRLKLPYFSYLLPRQALRQIVIGGRQEGQFSAFYFTVL